MHRKLRALNVPTIVLGLAFASPALATLFTFSTGLPDGRIGTASRPGTLGVSEIESADDFFTTTATSFTGGSLFGLLPTCSTIADIGTITVEIYRVFPADSDVGRTSGPPTFSTPQVPTRVNSPSDVEFADRSTADGNLSFTCTVVSNDFTVANTVIDGINPLPTVTTGGDGPATGPEVQCALTFTTPFDLPADHYFFVPQVALTGGSFLWLSAPRPIVAPGTPFMPDLQSWIRDADLAPDWLRVGTDIVGGTTFNAAFSLVGQTVPEPGTIALMLIAIGGAFTMSRRPRPTPA
jgi:hypothetical protein